MAQIIIPEGAAAATPATGDVTLYAKADGKLYSKDDLGVETVLGGGAGTSDHTLLSNLNSANYTHLSSTNATALTGGAVTNLHEHDFDNIRFPAANFIGTPSHIYSLQEFMNHEWSAGVVEGCALTDNGNGTVSIAAGVAVIRAVADGHTTLYGVALSAQLNIVLVDDATNYIYLDYTAGTPQFAVSTAITSFNCMDKCIAWMVHRAGSLLHWADAREQNVDSNRKLRQFLLRQAKFSHDAEGSVLGASGLALTLTAGSFNFMLQAIAHAAFDTSVAGTANTNVFTLWSVAGAAWTETANSKVVSTLLYNNIATGTVALANNKFGVSWVYVINNTPSELHVVMGQTEYTDLATARVASPPTTIPSLIAGLGSLVGFVVYEKGAVVFNNVYSAFSRAFSPSQASTHNGLAGIQTTSLIANDNFHLGTADVARLANTSGTNTGDQNLSGYELISNKATSFVTINDSLYPTVQAVKTYADGLVVGLLDDRGSYDASVNTFPAAGGSGTAGAVLKGDLWYISVAGTLGGVAVAIGDSVRALTDTPGQTATNWSVLESNIGYVPESVVNKSTSVVTDLASNTKYPSVKSVYDWVRSVFVWKTSATGSAIIPARTTVQRDVDTPAVGYFGYNTSTNSFEGYGSAGWADISGGGGGAKGGGTNKAFYENDHLITDSYTIGQETLISGATITSANPGVVTLTAHGFIAGQMVFFQTTGALPTNILVDTGYYVISTGLTADAFQLSLTDGGAAIDTTAGTQSGVHSCGKIKNAGTFGDVSVAAGVTITIPTGSSWSLT